MPSVYPEFYDRFVCRAGDCRHSCCRGWEIDVDAVSAARYRALPGTLGDDLRAALEQDGEGWHFRLDGEERCPFLRRDGLCRLICELGEEALCDICALHPRFFADCGGYELCGLGLSCEAVTALLLEAREPLGFWTEGERLSLTQLLQRLGVRCPEEALRFVPRLDRDGCRALVDAFKRTEPIDAHWPRELAELETNLDGLLAKGAFPDTAVYDRVLAYLLYRQLERLAEVPFERLLILARACTQFVYLEDALYPDTAEHLRRWSEQIEYSTENVDILLEALMHAKNGV